MFADSDAIAGRPLHDVIGTNRRWVLSVRRLGRDTVDAARRWTTSLPIGGRDAEIAAGVAMDPTSVPDVVDTTGRYGRDATTPRDHLPPTLRPDHRQADTP